MTFKEHFNWLFYIKQYTDLQRCGNKDQAWNHVNNYGWKENRIIFENAKINDAFYAFKTGKSININSNNKNIIVKNKIFSFDNDFKNKNILINSHSNLNLTAGDTIMIKNLLHYFSNNNNNVTLLTHIPFKDDELNKINNLNIIVNTDISKYIEENHNNYDLIFIRNHNILDKLIGKDYLYKTILYGLDVHVDSISKMNNQFKLVYTQSEKLKQLYIDNNIQEDKIELMPVGIMKYEFKLPVRTDNEIRMIYCGTLRDEENILEIIEEFQKIHKERPEVVLKIVYGKINGDASFTKKVNEYIKNGVNGITFKYNLLHKDACYEIATSDIGICWRKNGWGDNGEVSTKMKEYEMYNIDIFENKIGELNNFIKIIDYKRLNKITNIKCAIIVNNLNEKTYNELVILLRKIKNLKLICYCIKNEYNYKSDSRLIIVNKFAFYSFLKYSNVLVDEVLSNNTKTLIEKYNLLFFKKPDLLLKIKLYVVSSSCKSNHNGYSIRTNELLYNMDEYIITYNPLRHDNFKNIDNKNYISNNRNHLFFDKFKIKDLIYTFNIKNIIFTSDCNNFLTLYNYLKEENIPLIYTYELRGLWYLSALSKQQYKNENKGTIDNKRLTIINYQKQLEISAMNNADNLIFISDALKKYCINELNINLDNKKNIILDNSVNLDNTIKYNLKSSDIFTIGYFGSIVEYEGIELLIDVLLNLNKKYKVNLLLIGSKSYDIKLNNYVKHISWVSKEQLEKYYHNINLFCIPRKSYDVCEIIPPLKPFNLLYNKIPLLVSDCEVLKDISNNGENCMLFKKNDVNDLYKKIEYVINNGYDKKLLNNGYNFIINERIWNLQQNKFKNLFLKTILIAGHDLKFINNIIIELKDYYNIIIDKWTGHNKHDINKSIKLLNNADIIICEWCLGNAVFYSNNKMSHQKLFIRLHRVEITTEYINKLNINNIDGVLYVSPSWNIISNQEYKFNTIKDVYYFKNDLHEYFKPCYNKINKKHKNCNKISIGMCGILPLSLKNPSKAIEIINSLKEKYEITFYLLGKKPSELQWLVNSHPEEIKNYSIFETFLKNNTNFISCGFINNECLYDYFIKLDFLLVTSNVESFHKSSLEALMSGVIPIFYGDYGKHYCKFNWLNDFCFEKKEDVIDYIDYITNMDDKLIYLKPIIDKYWNHYNTKTITNKLVNYIEFNIKNNKKFLLICLNSNLNYIDGSITFMSNLINTLNKDFNIILILPNQKFIYKNKKDYFNSIYHYHVLHVNENIEDVITKYNISFDIHKIFIRGFNIQYTNISNDILEKTYHYLINNNNITNNTVNYITQTDVLKSKYNDLNIKFILYPTCNVIKDQNYKKSSDKINIAYTGTIRKEFMSLELLTLMYELSKYDNFVITIIMSKFHIIGDYKTKIEELLKKFESKNNVNIYRKLPHEKTIEILKTVDYGFNFKNTSSDQKGEISTKIIEYINYNIKPIINDSSDEIIFFNSNYPFLISNNQYNTESLKENIIKYKNHNIQDYINNNEFSKYSYENYKKTLYNIFS